MNSADSSKITPGVYTCQTCKALFTCLKYYQQHRRNYGERNGIKQLTCSHCPYSAHMCQVCSKPQLTTVSTSPSEPIGIDCISDDEFSSSAMIGKRSMATVTIDDLLLSSNLQKAQQSSRGMTSKDIISSLIDHTNNFYNLKTIDAIDLIDNKYTKSTGDEEEEEEFVTNDTNAPGVYTCQKCNALFTCLEYYQQHRRNHAECNGIKLFTCSHCPYSSDNSFHYNCHVMSHNGKSAHKCQVCSKPQLTTLSTSIDLYKSNLIPFSMISADSSKITPGVYTCQTCNALYTCLEYYQHHQRNHAECNGIKLLTCSHCPYSAHMCQVCSKPQLTTVSTSTVKQELISIDCIDISDDEYSSCAMIGKRSVATATTDDLLLSSNLQTTQQSSCGLTSNDIMSLLNDQTNNIYKLKTNDAIDLMGNKYTNSSGDEEEEVEFVTNDTNGDKESEVDEK